MANLFIGIKGTAIAIDRATGKEVWATHLKGGDFVNLVLDGDELFAGSRGQIYRLDPATGRILWVNELPGKGWGLVTIAQAANGNLPAMAEKRRREDAAAGPAAAST
jgi:outer membrane protein assembly factor BamB